MEKLKIKEAVIVEGKYDKITLSSIIDGIIITTDGFRLFKDRELAELIRRYAEGDGIIVLTDSDDAGFRIRNRIKSICPNGRIINIYIPDVPGKERRKAEPSKEGKLGVEGIDAATLRQLFEQAGVAAEQTSSGSISDTDMYELGLSGSKDSAERRRKLAKKLSLPERISRKAWREHLGRMLTKDQLTSLCAGLDKEDEA